MANVAKQTTENKGTQFISKMGTLIYVHLFKPTRYQDKEDSKLTKSVTLLLDKDSPDVELLKTMINAEWKKGNLKSGGHNPLRWGDEVNQERQEEGKEPIEAFEGRYYINFKTDANFKVRVVNGKRETVTDESVDSNCWEGRVIGKLKWYKNNKDQFGITCYLNAAQLVKVSDIQVGGDVSNLFDIVETEEDEELPF